MGEEVSSQLVVYDGGLTILLKMSMRQEPDAEAEMLIRQCTHLFPKSKGCLETVSHNERLTPSNKELEASKAASHQSIQTHIFISIHLEELKMEIIFF